MTQVVDCVLISAQPFTELHRRNRSLHECYRFCGEAHTFVDDLLRLGFRLDELPRSAVNIYCAWELVTRTEPCDDIVDFMFHVNWSQNLVVHTITALDEIGAYLHARFLSAVHLYLVSIQYDPSRLDQSEFDKVVAKAIKDHIPDEILRERYGSFDEIDRMWRSICFHGAKYMEGWTNIRRVTGGAFYQAELLKLVADADANAIGVRDATALIRASAHGHLDVMRGLLNAGANPNVRTSDGSTALFAAAREGQHEAAQILLAANAEIDATANNGDTALMIASKNGHADVARALLTAGANVNAKNNSGSTALLLASEWGHLTIVEKLIATFADVNARGEDGRMALIAASQGLHPEVVRALLTAGADVNAVDNAGGTALMSAAFPYSNSYPGGAAALERDRREVAGALIAAGANVNFKDKMGRTTLIAASIRGQLELMQVLLGANAEVNAQDAHGFTAIIGAVVSGSPHSLDLVRDLLAACADVNAKMTDGHTALMNAATGDIEVVRALLAAGADVNAKTVRHDATALSWAAMRGRLDVVQALLAAGADVDAKRTNGMTSLFFAAENGQLRSREGLGRGKRRCECQNNRGCDGFNRRRPKWSSRGGEVLRGTGDRDPKIMVPPHIAAVSRTRSTGLHSAFSRLCLCAARRYFIRGAALRWDRAARLFAPGNNRIRRRPRRKSRRRAR